MWSSFSSRVKTGTCLGFIYGILLSSKLIAINQSLITHPSDLLTLIFEITLTFGFLTFLIFACLGWIPTKLGLKPSFSTITIVLYLLIILIAGHNVTYLRLCLTELESKALWSLIIYLSIVVFFKIFMGIVKYFRWSAEPRRTSAFKEILIPILATIIVSSVHLAGYFKSAKNSVATSLETEKELIKINPNSALYNNILLLGLDGVQWDVLAPAIKMGILPSLKSILKYSSYGYMQSYQPTQSAALWTTVATGKMPAQTGVNGFVSYQFKGLSAPLRKIPTKSLLGILEYLRLMKVKVLESNDLSCPTIWDIGSYFSLSSLVINWWLSFPPQALQGASVSNYLYYGQEFNPDAQTICYPKTVFQSQLKNLVPSEKNLETQLYSFLNTDLKPNPSSDRFPWKFLLGPRALYQDEVYQAFAQELYKRYKPWLIAFYLNGTDPAEHYFYRFYDPERCPGPNPKPEEVQIFGKVIEKYYQYADSLVEKFLNDASDKSLVIILSDHGMEHTPILKQYYKRYLKKSPYMYGQHDYAPPGIFIISGAGIKPYQRLEKVTLADLAPTILAASGLPIAQDLPGKALYSCWKPSIADLLKKNSSTISSYNNYISDKNHRAPNIPVPENQFIEKLKALGYL